MANAEHLALLKRGVSAWNRWRSSELVEVDLRGAILEGTELIRADLTIADLRNAQLGRANLHEADLREALLCDADLAEANLRNAKLHRADLRRANLKGAALNRTDLHQARLDHAVLRNAFLYDSYIVDSHLDQTDMTDIMVGSTVFSRVDLSRVIGLDTARHSGPSSIGLDTLYLSAGNIPEEFMRGAGVSDTLITFSKSLVGGAIEFYSCFISYSTKDQAFADRLYADLQASGVRAWFAPHDIVGGKKVHEQIDDAIRLHDRLLLILSEHSMTSTWVETEISKARKRELRERRRMLFPVRLVDFQVLRNWECFDADTGKDSAREIREYFIPDFSNWKNHDDYKKALGALLRDLKASGDGHEQPRYPL